MSKPLPTRRFTVDEYYRMTEVGILRAGERVELIEGEIIEMAAIGSRHAACVRRLQKLLTAGVADRGLVSVQNPVRLSDLSEPEPDIAVVKPSTDDYASAHPRAADVLLIVEVADTSVDFDREQKAFLYSLAGIAEYWLMDLPADLMEVYRWPSPDGYRDVRRLRRDDSLRPVAFPDLELSVSAILPPPAPVE
jgi:Uma2 family endonuclease